MEKNNIGVLDSYLLDAGRLKIKKSNKIFIIKQAYGIANKVTTWFIIY